MQKLICLILISFLICSCNRHDKAIQIHLDAKKQGEVCYEITSASEPAIVGDYCLRSMSK